MTFKVLTTEGKVIGRSVCRSARITTQANPKAVKMDTDAATGDGEHRDVLQLLDNPAPHSGENSDDSQFA